MKLKKKYISKKNWKRAIEKEEFFIPFNYENLTGEIALLNIKKVNEPLYENYDETSIKIADDGYLWLQIAIDKRNYWITAMYNDKKELIQIYIDITKENRISLNGESYFYDLFLDIVKLSNGKIFLLDEEELKTALEERIISKADYNLAYNEAKNIISQIRKNEFMPIKLCDLYLEKLLKK